MRAHAWDGVDTTTTTWKRQVEEESGKVGLRREDVLCGSKWSVGVYQVAAGLR